MKKLTTDVHRVTRAGETICISLREVVAADFEEDEPGGTPSSLEIVTETLDIPVVTSEIELWDGGARLYPHLHYTCPRCRQLQNADLYDDDSNPRFGVCDSCGWESLVWIEWDESARATMDLDKARYLAREIEAMNRETPSVSQIDGLMYSLESFAKVDPDTACRLVLKLKSVAFFVFTPETRRTRGPWIDAYRTPVIVGRLTELAAANADAETELKEACLKLLEELQGD